MDSAPTPSIAALSELYKSGAVSPVEGCLEAFFAGDPAEVAG